MSIGHTLQTAYYVTDVNRVKKVEQVAEERDLGILIKDDMKWRNQCNSAAAKPMSELGMIKRTFSALNKEMFPCCTQHILDLTLNIVFNFGHHTSRKILKFL